MPNLIEFGFTNLEETKSKLASLGVSAAPELAKALYQQAEAVMATSKEQVPVDTGALRSSGHVQPPEVSGGVAQVTLGYGGPGVDYAVYVHEDLTKHHPHGKAKYLEDPLTAAIPTIDKALADALQGLIDRAGK